MPADIDTTRPLGDILARLADLGRAERVSVGDVVDTFGEASFLTALMVPALIVVSPLSGIFLLPTVMGLMLALIALQMIVGRRTLWLPGFILRRSIAGPRLARAAARLSGPADWIDRRTRARLTYFLVWPISLIPQLGCLAAGLMMPFLELVPLSSSILGGAVTLFALSLLTRDGLFVIYGLASLALASIIPIVVLDRLG